MELTLLLHLGQFKPLFVLHEAPQLEQFTFIPDQGLKSQLGHLMLGDDEKKVTMPFCFFVGSE